MPALRPPVFRRAALSDEAAGSARRRRRQRLCSWRYLRRRLDARFDPPAPLSPVSQNGRQDGYEQRLHLGSSSSATSFRPSSDMPHWRGRCRGILLGLRHSSTSCGRHLFAFVVSICGHASSACPSRIPACVPPGRRPRFFPFLIKGRPLLGKQALSLSTALARPLVLKELVQLCQPVLVRLTPASGFDAGKLWVCEWT
jgi:hypothetical protein